MSAVSTLRRGARSSPRVEAFEHSAGGLVCRKGRILLIRMRNLRGEMVWTFPKGHLEGSETAREAALREVFEESGWECSMLARAAIVRYSFEREGRRVNKRVDWFWMKPERRTGSPKAGEIFAARWAAFKTAERLLAYPKDLRLLAKARAFPSAGRASPRGPLER
ncbi:MAG: NUDIX domain-containing protein [Elusimicrobiota bacterium]|jgi:ADP-ribose pyrophosphatase YjhB (NUDIX family)